jgi:hypothetical protein
LPGQPQVDQAWSLPVRDLPGGAPALAGTVVPLELGAALVRVDTGQPGTPASTVAAVTAALGW